MSIRVGPETTVAWEGDRASGTVGLAPAGWRTKVTSRAATTTAGIRPPAPPLDAGGATAILGGVLDDLGVAHHRPISRSTKGARPEPRPGHERPGRGACPRAR